MSIYFTDPQTYGVTVGVLLVFTLQVGLHTFNKNVLLCTNKLHFGRYVDAALNLK